MVWLCGQWCGCPGCQRVKVSSLVCVETVGGQGRDPGGGADIWMEPSLWCPSLVWPVPSLFVAGTVCASPRVQEPGNIRAGARDEKLVVDKNSDRTWSVVFRFLVMAIVCALMNANNECWL